MENKGMKKPVPVELEDEALDTVSGGTEPSQNEESMLIDPFGGMMKFQVYNEAEKSTN